MSPTGGFGGMVTKPWERSQEDRQQLLVEIHRPLSRDRRRARDPVDAVRFRRQADSLLTS